MNGHPTHADDPQIWTAPNLKCARCGQTGRGVEEYIAHGVAVQACRLCVLLTVVESEMRRRDYAEVAAS
jgi:late competence protein required for DNA uptake (superfamily II DNA/RNA helicase)